MNWKFWGIYLSYVLLRVVNSVVCISYFIATVILFYFLSEAAILGQFNDASVISIEGVIVKGI